MQIEAGKLANQNVVSIEYYYGHTGMEETSNYSEIYAFIKRSDGDDLDNKSSAKEISLPVCSKCPYTQGDRGIVCSGLTLRDDQQDTYIKAELNSGIYLSRRSWWNEVESFPCQPQINF